MCARGVANIMYVWVMNLLLNCVAYDNGNNNRNNNDNTDSVNKQKRRRRQCHPQRLLCTFRRRCRRRCRRQVSIKRRPHHLLFQHTLRNLCRIINVSPGSKNISSNNININIFRSVLVARQTLLLRFLECL